MFQDDQSSRQGGDFPSQQQIPRRRQSKLGVQNELAGVNIDKCKLERGELLIFVNLFRKLEKPIIQFIDFLTIAKKISYDITPKVKELVLKEMEARGIKKLDLDSSLILISCVKDFFHRIDEENQLNPFSEYVDAFVALGGNPDQTGKVAKATILEIIQEEFELTIDMEIFLEKIEAGGDQLDFPSFCMLFENGDDKRTLTKSNSVLSILSNRSKRSVKSNKSLRVKYSDFEKFYSQMEQQERENNKLANSNIQEHSS